MNSRSRGPCRWAALVLLPAFTGTVMFTHGAEAADRSARTLTVTRPPPLQRNAVVPSQVLPGAPIPWSGSPVLTPPDLSIVDGQTRFLTTGPAEERCPGDRVVFVPGVVNPFRPTVPGDGAFMCHGDAVAQGFVGP